MIVAILLLLPVGLMLYAYLVYPLLLRAGSIAADGKLPAEDPPEWPTVSITVPAHNEAGSIGDTIEALLTLDYPAERRQILIVSDASTDGTDDIVRRYANRGVELLRLETRGGKTAAENAAARHLTGEIVINTDATIRILPDALKPLIRVFQDRTIGVASGRDVSVGDIRREASTGEAGYVGYEMKIRAMETKLGGIIGASGCFYAIRGSLHSQLFPEALSRDFASALISRENGLRAVSVDQAVCLVPRSKSIQAEFRRKIRTMARGLDTLWYKRHLLNPFRYGLFAWMLLSHKLVRWLVFLTLPLGFLGLVLWSLQSRTGGFLLAAVLVGVLMGIIGMRWPAGNQPPRLVGLAGFVLATHIAGLLAWIKALRGERNPIWEPTRRS